MDKIDVTHLTKREVDRIVKEYLPLRSLPTIYIERIDGQVTLNGKM